MISFANAIYKHNEIYDVRVLILVWLIREWIIAVHLLCESSAGHYVLVFFLTVLSIVSSSLFVALLPIRDRCVIKNNDWTRLNAASDTLAHTVFIAVLNVRFLAIWEQIDNFISRIGDM